MKSYIYKLKKIQILFHLYQKYKYFRFEKKSMFINNLGFIFKGNKLMIKGDFEKKETIVINHLLNKVNCFINIGANIGYYCCFSLNKNIKTIAFEPIQSNLKYLYDNILSNGWEDNFECYPIALSHKPSLTKIYGSGTGASLINGWNSQHYFSVVPTSTLNIILGDRFKNIKKLIVMDVEGSEYCVLNGSDNILAEVDSSIWFIEISIFENQPEGIKFNPNLIDTFNKFFSFGYECIAINDSFDLVSIDNIIEITNNNFDYLKTHNFIFVSKSISYELAYSLRELF